MNKHIIISIFISILAFNSFAQNFNIIDTLPTGAYGTAEWGDFDGDGFKDLVYISQVLPTAACKIYHNQNNVFTEVSQQFPLLYNPAAKWADLDNDGFEDLVVCGLDSVLNEQTFIYKSLGNGNFNSMPHTIPGLSSGSISLADYNNDSLIDIAISGYGNSPGPEAYIFKNTGAFQFNNIITPLVGLTGGETSWHDYNHDNLPDLVATGNEGNQVRIRFYRNMGSDVFQEESFSFPGAVGTVDWIDYDLDGIDDLFVTGVDSSFVHNLTSLYRNDGLGNFTLIPTNIPEFGEPSAVDIADFNNDSIMDICLTGGNAIYFSYSVIAYGQGNSTFSFQVLPQAIIDNLFVDAADIDNDGDMDLVMSTYILRNDGTTTGVSQNEKSRSDIFLYPNPSRNELNIISSKQIDDYTFYDSQGRLVLEKNNSDNTEKILTSLLPTGKYILKLKFKTGDSVSKSILIE